MSTIDFTRVTAVAVPARSRASNFYAAPDLADAYAVSLPDAALRNPEALARFMFAQQAPWVARLMAVRDAVMSMFGVKTSRQLERAPPSSVRRVSIFRIYDQDADEILLGEDDRHLDFRVTVRCEPAAGNATGQQLVVSTVVDCHNRLGRLYILAIAPFHRLVVRSMLRRAALAGWPPAR